MVQCHFLPLIIICIAWTVRNYPLKYALLVGGVFLCTYTGFGMSVGALWLLLMTSDLWGRRKEINATEMHAGLLALLLMFVLLLSFFAGFKFSDGTSPRTFTNSGTGMVVSYPKPLHYFLFVAFMLADFVGLKATIKLAPSVIAGAALLFFYSRRICYFHLPKNLVAVAVIADFLFAGCCGHHGAWTHVSGLGGCIGGPAI